ncbi:MULTISPECIES: hypothetical protein [Escherichia]|uniref:hypothetical protein n=1 Tax=Escherichia TaxID=561 RepID=UPI000CF79290|nr:hypothetical protein [Escherichia sp. MOD1-EC6163]EFA4859541.1 hypothetical protein [Escherichia coli]EFA4944745.1 hypothetical protein [Escherichia coli]EIQ2078897.1 hypothetical protein [Escherichia coli]EKS5497968.1 hypothetical protein [Escherichia coli]MEB5813943.1 hypothetical protein [Escherichia coli]
MVTKSMHIIEIVKLFFQLVRDDEKKYEPEVYVHTMPKNGLGSIKIHGRGGLEVSSSEIKKSPEFKAMVGYAKERVKHDSSLNDLPNGYEQHLPHTKFEAEHR